MIPTPLGAAAATSAHAQHLETLSKPGPLAPPPAPDRGCALGWGSLAPCPCPPWGRRRSGSGFHVSPKQTCPQKPSPAQKQPPAAAAAPGGTVPGPGTLTQRGRWAEHPPARPEPPCPARSPGHRRPTPPHTPLTAFAPRTTCCPVPPAAAQRPSCCGVPAPAVPAAARHPPVGPREGAECETGASRATLSPRWAAEHKAAIPRAPALIPLAQTDTR